MKVVSCTSEHLAALAQGLDHAGLDAPLLRIPSYVQHYYLSSPTCRLQLLINPQGQIAATLGTEQVRLRIGAHLVDGAVLSSTYSLLPGAFPLLFMHWLRSAGLGLAFPGNALLEQMFARQTRWRAMPGLRTYWLNWAYPPQAGDPAWKRMAKPLVRWARRVDASHFESRLRGVAPAGLALHEERRFDETMVPHASNFGFRLEAEPDALNWRFDSTLAHVRYRIFRIERAAHTCGHVVVAEWPHCLVLSQADCDDAHTLGCAILLAIARLNQGPHRYRKVLLSSMHDGMQRLLQGFGFAPAPGASPFYMAGADQLGLPPEPHRDWLVNLDLGDAGIVLGLVYKP